MFFFNKKLFEKGITNVVDHIDMGGNIYTFERLKEAYNIKRTFLDYQTLITKIPRTWKEIIKEHTTKCKDMKYNVSISAYLKLVFKDKKGIRSIYDKIIPVNQLQTTNRWNKDLGDIASEEMKTFNKNLKYIKEIKLRDFQYKINNIIMSTNSFLF